MANQTGTAGADTLFGTAGADRLDGAEGNDTLVGGRGYDTLLGGAGRDVFRYQSLEELIDSDQFDDFSDGDLLDFSAIAGLRVLIAESLPAGVTPSTNSPVLLVRQRGLLELWTSAAAPAGSMVVYLNVEESSPGSRILQVVPGVVRTGGDGPATLTGGRGMDTLSGGSGDERLLGGEGDDLLRGGAGNDTLIGGQGADILQGGPGRDVFRYESVEELFDLDWLQDFSPDDLLDLSALTSLRVVFAEGLPAGIQPTDAAPVLLVRSSGALQVWTTAVRPRAELLLFRAVEETAPGSRIFQAVAGIRREGTALADVLSGGLADDTLVGAAGNDSLSGGAGRDKLEGGDGDDTLSGGPGYDGLTTGAGRDVIVYASLDELIEGDWIADFSGSDRVDLTAIAGLRVAHGESLPAGLNPSESAPVVLVRAGGLLEVWTQSGASRPWTTLYLGRPVAETSPGSRVLQGQEDLQRIGQSGAESLVGGLGYDTLRGEGGDDTIIGGDGDDVLWGGGGADLLLSGPGRDTLRGGGGADTFRFQTLADLSTQKVFEVLDEGDRLDLSAIPGLRILWGNTVPADVEVSSSSPVLMVHAPDPMARQQEMRLYVASRTQQASLFLWDGVNGVMTLEETAAGSRILRLSPALGLVGTQADERLLGGAGSDTLDGGEGADTLEGGASIDFLRGGAGNDLLIGGAGRDVLTGGPGADTFRVTNLEDFLQGDAIADFSEDDRLDLSAVPGLRIVFGQSLPADIVPSDAAPVLLVAPNGLLMAYAAPGRAAVWMHPIHAVLVETAPGSRILTLEPARNSEGTSASETLAGSARSERIAGGEGNDTLKGGFGDDTLVGGPGSDDLTGDDGNDQLHGGPGDDRLDGGAGADRFVLDALLAKGESDIISNFDADDRLDLSAIPGLRFVWGDRLPDGLVPTATTPVAWIRSGQVRLYSSASDYGTVSVWLSEYGTPWPAVLEETAPGSGVLKAVSPSRIIGTPRSDTLAGGVGSDLLEGGLGNDLISGGAGVDRLLGGSGDDTLIGGAGDDNLDGGSGSDTYRYDALADVSVAESLALGAGDRLDFSRIPGVRVVFADRLTVPSSAASPVVLVQPGNWIYLVEDPSVPWRMIWVGEVALAETRPGSGILEVQARTKATAEGSLLSGTPQPDVLQGGPGPDTLVASGGTDALSGGGSRDVFRFLSLDHLSASTRVLDFDDQDLLDFSAIPGLKIAFGDSLPAQAAPTQATPWLLVKSNGFLQVYDGVLQTQPNGARVDLLTGPLIAGNPALRETEPGSRVLQRVPQSEAVQTRWFDASGQERAASSGAPIQLVMVAEGYLQGQQDVFFAKAQELAGRLFEGGITSTFAPLDRYAALFEVVAFFVPSRDKPEFGKATADTAFRTSTFASIGAVGGDDARVISFVDALLPGAAARVPVVLMNIDTGRSTGGSAIWLVAGLGTDDSNVLVHEMGHSLFGFADEYADLGISQGYPAAPGIQSAHLSSSPTQVSWAHWLGFEDNLGTVGVFEGGLYRETGVWRATAQSMMRHGGEFNAPQKEAIVARLYELWGDYLTLVLQEAPGLVAQSLAPSVLAYEWQINGKVIAHTGSSLDADQLKGLGVQPLQRVEVQVRTVDSSGLLRLPSLVDASRQSESAFVIWGTSGGDSVQGTAESEWLIGGGGNDLLRGLGGHDTIDGGSGFDAVEFSQARGEYRLGLGSGGRLVIIDKVDGRDGADTLVGVEQLRFADGRAVTIESRPHGGFADIPDAMYQFFILAFGAAPGVEYLQQCADAYRGGASVKLITNVFTSKSQFTDIYPTTLSNAEMARKLVTNVVGSSATQAARDEAVRDITGALDGGLSRGDMIFTVFSNLAALKGDAKWGGTAQLFFNQIAVAKVYTETMNQSTTDRATLAAAISAVTPASDVSTEAAIVTLIGQGLLG